MRLTQDELDRIVWLRGYGGIGILTEGDTMWIIQPVDGGNKDPMLFDSIEIESVETLEDLRDSIDLFLEVK